MKAMRKMEVLINGEQGGFQVGDQIRVGRYYTATCQKVGKHGAIFLFDQYLDEARPMNRELNKKCEYEDSDLREFLKGFAMNSMFDKIRERMVPFKKTDDLLRIPTAEEIFGPEEAHEYYDPLSNKRQWILMRNRRNRIAFRGENINIEWGWLQNKCTNSSFFACVTGDGYESNYSTSTALGVRVVFRLK